MRGGVPSFPHTPSYAVGQTERCNVRRLDKLCTRNFWGFGFMSSGLRHFLVRQISDQEVPDAFFISVHVKMKAAGFSETVVAHVSEVSRRNAYSQIRTLVEARLCLCVNDQTGPFWSLGLCLGSRGQSEATHQRPGSLTGSPCEICGGQSGTAIGFPASTQVFPFWYIFTL